MRCDSSTRKMVRIGRFLRKPRPVWWWVGASLTLGFVLLVATSWAVYMRRTFVPHLRPSSETTSAATPAIAELLSKLRRATEEAAGGNHTLSAEDRARWNSEHPCKSRGEFRALYRRGGAAQGWDLVLEEYSNLHRACLGGRDLRALFEARESVPGCRFAVADYSLGGGLGNKLLAIASTALFAVLTQRVVLVPSTTLLPELLCEPFAGSSWGLDAGAFPLPPWDFPHLWTTHRDVFSDLDAASPLDRIFASGMERYQYQPAGRFFCDTEQERFGAVPWLYFTGCIYTVPKLFAVPAFRPALEELFPDRLALTRLLRSIMLPNDLVWDQTMAVHAEQMRGAGPLVGLQLRFRPNVHDFSILNGVVNERVLRCGAEHGFLPGAVDRADPAEEKPRAESKGDVRIFVASLFPGFRDFAGEVFRGREEVRVVQLSNQMTQDYGLEVDRQGLVEMLMLSLCDVLVVSPLSTFGGVAQAYGGLRPFVLEFRSDGVERPPCQRAQTVDVCFQEAAWEFDCPYDHLLDGRRISDEVPYIRNCLLIDAADGVQLITNETI